MGAMAMIEKGGNVLAVAPINSDNAVDNVVESSYLRLARRTILIVLLVWGGFYGIALAGNSGAGSDFAAFYAAARATAAGADPYNWPTLWHWENALLNNGPHHWALHFNFAPYGNPPPFASLLAPVTLLFSPRFAYVLWAIGSQILTITAGSILARWAGHRHYLLVGFLISLAPCATFGLFLGQDSWLSLIAMVAAVSLVMERPFSAGVVLILLGFAKPHLLIPLTVVIVLAYPHQRRSFSQGLGAGTVIWLAITVILTGGNAIPHWFNSLLLFRQSIAAQPDIASLAGFYTAWAPDHIVTLLDGLLALSAAALLLWTRPRRHSSMANTHLFLALGVTTVLIALPYTHTHDDVLLAVPLLILAGPGWHGLANPLVLLAAVATLLVPLGIFTDYHRPVISMLPALCTLLACLHALRTNNHLSDLSRISLRSVADALYLGEGL